MPVMTSTPAGAFVAPHVKTPPAAGVSVSQRAVLPDTNVTTPDTTPVPPEVTVMEYETGTP